MPCIAVHWVYCLQLTQLQQPVHRDHLIFDQILPISWSSLIYSFTNWSLSESMIPFVEVSPKAWYLLLKSLRKHEAFRWNLSERMKPLLEVSPKAWSLSLKSLRKHDTFLMKSFQMHESFRKSSLKAFLKARKSRQNNFGEPTFRKDPYHLGNAGSAFPQHLPPWSIMRWCCVKIFFFRLHLIPHSTVGNLWKW